MTEQDLWGYKDAKKRCDEAKARLDEYEARIYYPATQRLGEEHGGGGFGDGFARITATHDKLLREYELEMTKASQAFNLLLLVKGILADGERQFLQERYMLCKSWEDTASALHYSKKSIARIRADVLKKIARF